LPKNLPEFPDKRIIHEKENSSNTGKCGNTRRANRPGGAKVSFSVSERSPGD
jgi:hypothetical protein